MKMVEKIAEDLMEEIRNNVVGLTNVQLKQIEVCCFRVLVG